MITYQQARQIAASVIQQPFSDGDELIIIDEHTIEKDYAWIFSYTSKLYWETNDIIHALAGNSPIFVSKLDGKVATYSSAQSMENMMDEHEEANNIWQLSLAENIFHDAHKMLAFKQALYFSNEQLAACKAAYTLPFEIGSQKRLLKIQQQLHLKGITTCLAFQLK